MGSKTGIFWCDMTFNTHWGCTKVSDECKNCYADTLSKRFGDDIWGPLAGRKPMGDKYWNQIARWNRQAEKLDFRPRVFCDSMADVFEGPETCQTEDAYAVVTAGRDRLFREIEAAPNLDFLLLTKRPENMKRFQPEHWAQAWPSNVWAGTSVGTQAAIKRVRTLADIPAVVRFLSVEPLLEAIDFQDTLKEIEWVIVGGESGPGSRPMLVEWVRDIKAQSVESGSAFLFKQWGGVHKKETGRELDGRTWDEYPVRRTL